MFIFLRSPAPPQVALCTGVYKPAQESLNLRASFKFIKPWAHGFLFFIWVLFFSFSHFAGRLHWKYLGCFGDFPSEPSHSLLLWIPFPGVFAFNVLGAYLNFAPLCVWTKPRVQRQLVFLINRFSLSKWLRPRTGSNPTQYWLAVFPLIMGFSLRLSIFRSTRALSSEKRKMDGEVLPLLWRSNK